MFNKRKKGAQFEELALEFLLSKGMVLLEKNFYHPFGEIDLILCDEDTLVFTEVKGASSFKFGNPIQKVTKWKQDRLLKGANYYMKSKGYQISNLSIRFDVLGVVKESGTFNVFHIPNAFGELES